MITCVKRESRHFTFLEILIALAIISFFGTVFALNIRPFVKEQRALNEMEKVVNLVREAQELMIWSGLDTEVKFSTDRENRVVKLLPISPPPPSLRALFHRKELKLEILDQVYFEDLEQKKEENFSLKFFAKGYLLPVGILQMRSDQVVRSLLFPGHLELVKLKRGTPQVPTDQELKNFLREMNEQTERDIAS